MNEQVRQILANQVTMMAAMQYLLTNVVTPKDPNRAEFIKSLTDAYANSLERLKKSGS